jgi:serine/threonine protein kinase
MISQLIVGLFILHTSKNKIVHRDLKMGSIFVDKDEDLKIGFFFPFLFVLLILFLLGNFGSSKKVCDFI